MIAFIVTLIIIFLFAALASIIILFDELANWMNESDLDVKEWHQNTHNTDLDNTEYDWGHNVKNYMEE